MDNMEGRIAKVFDKSGLDAIILMNTDTKDSNLIYITELDGVFEQSILIARRNGAEFLTSKLEYATAEAQKQRFLKVREVSSGKQIRQILKKLKGKTIGVNYGFLPYYYYKVIKKHTGARQILDASGALSKARMVKYKDEISKIAIANRIAKKAFEGISEHLKEGITEQRLAAIFDNSMRLNGADEPSFRTIVAFGKNTALPHHFPGNTRLKANSFVIIDAGAKYKNYCSDLTRTYIFKPDKRSSKYQRMLGIYNTVKDAQSLALKAIKPGIECSKIHEIAANHIDTASNGAYKGRFTHALGHSIGIDVHDPGFYISPGCKTRLRQGMVFSNEPGIYVEGFGGVRLEEDVVVTKSGAKVL